MKVAGRQAGESGLILRSVAPLEKQKAGVPEPTVRRLAVIVPPFSKPAPSKWDDAQKWISSPNSNRTNGGDGPNGGGSKVNNYSKNPDSLGGGTLRRNDTKVIAELVDNANTKKINPTQVEAASAHRAAKWESKPVVDSSINLGQPDTSPATRIVSNLKEQASELKCICTTRDVGTEMSPFTSQEPSQTGSPVRFASSLPVHDPSRLSISRITTSNSNSIQPDDPQEETEEDLFGNEVQIRTRRAIVITDPQLGDKKIAAWAHEEAEKNDASSSLRIIPLDQQIRSILETRATIWEEAEKTKYLARYKQEEMKIEAWENLQKAKADAESKKIEVDLEKMRVRAHERLMSKLASAQNRAEEKRARAKLQWSQEAARTAQKAQFIRRTGHIPSKFSCWGWCP